MSVQTPESGPSGVPIKNRSPSSRPIDSLGQHDRCKIIEMVAKVIVHSDLPDDGLHGVAPPYVHEFTAVKRKPLPNMDMMDFIEQTCMPIEDGTSCI